MSKRSEEHAMTPMVARPSQVWWSISVAREGTEIRMSTVHAMRRVKH